MWTGQNIKTIDNNLMCTFLMLLLVFLMELILKYNTELSPC